MIRVVLDTNVVVSAYLNPDGLPFFITKLALSRIIQLCSSEPILAEYEELLQRKSYPLDRRLGKLLLVKLRAASIVVKPAGHLSETSDPDDNIFLECAQASKAEYIITGNSGHFPASWKYTKIVTPRGFINVWKDLYGGTGAKE